MANAENTSTTGGGSTPPSSGVPWQLWVIYAVVCWAVGAYFVIAPRFGLPVPNPTWGLLALVLLLSATVVLLGRPSDAGVLKELIKLLPQMGNAIQGTFGVVLIIGVLSFWFIWAVVHDNSFMGNEFSRGLITVTFTFGTMLTAFVLVLTSLFGGAGKAGTNDAEQKSLQELLKMRFDMGKDVLGLLIGIFGTILGFYFGSSTEDTVRRRTVSAIEMLGGEVDGTTVYLNKPQVGDLDLADLRRLPKVERLRLDNSGVTDKGIVYLFDLKDLKELSLRGTAVSKERVQALVEAFKSDSKTLKVIPDWATLQPSASEAPAAHASPAPQAPGAPAADTKPAAPKPEMSQPPSELAPKVVPATPKPATTVKDSAKQPVNPTIPP